MNTRKRRKLAGIDRNISVANVPPLLNLEALRAEAIVFADVESTFPEPSLFGVTDGKAIGTYLEHKFQAYLQGKYQYERGNSAKGIDFPELDVDVKVTSTIRPQSFCEFKSARQKIYGLGYSLLVFVYEKCDDPQMQTSRLDIRHVIFVEKERTADYQITVALRKMIENGANRDDILGCFEEHRLPIDNGEGHALAEEVLCNPPPVGYLTISRALQWKLRYSRVIEQGGKLREA